MRAGRPPTASSSQTEHEELELIQDLEYKRFGTSIDFDLAVSRYNVYRSDAFDEGKFERICFLFLFFLHIFALSFVLFLPVKIRAVVNVLKIFDRNWND